MDVSKVLGSANIMLTPHSPVIFPIYIVYYVISFTSAFCEKVQINDGKVSFSNLFQINIKSE